MGAIFVTTGDDILKAYSGNAALIKSDLTDDLGQDNLSILTGASVVYNELIQFFQSFDDLIHHYYFGKGLGQIRLDLMCFTDCNSGNAPGIASIVAKIGKIRGKKVDFTIGTEQVTGVLMEFNISAQAEPLPHFIVSITLGMVDHTLPKAKITAKC
jgi:hypothetical protein